MPFEFEQLDVWRRSRGYIDLIDEIGALLPKSEEYNLKSQMVRAATSVALNIAEGSTYREAEQFVAMLHSLRRTIAPDQKWLREGEIMYQADGDNDAFP